MLGGAEHHDDPELVGDVVEAVRDGRGHEDRVAGAVLCTTESPDDPVPPTLRRTGPFLYLRLRRSAYSDEELDAWARRLVPFLDDGLDAYVLFRHDEDGTSAIRAEAFGARVERVRTTG